MSESTLQRDDFKQLMTALAEGSEEAAWQIAKDYTPHILRAVRMSLPNSIRPKLDSQDFAQIIWASLLVKRDNLAGVQSPDDLIRLLVRISRNKVVDAYRRYVAYQMRDSRRESRIDQVSEKAIFDRELSPSQQAHAKEKWQNVLQELSARDTTILRQRMDGKTYSEIAGSVGVGITTVREVLNRIVTELRDGR